MMSNNEPLLGAFYDANTGESFVRELTAEEIEALHLDTDENSLPSLD
jgi:hypothetical protein